ncbi:MAG: DPP IV N-terminal domain-containing protein, partial [Thermoanaerobaculia bacterium]|nr:DPP IV N-terminal domain-containing protein [Thermoanaerobaculia bacterium]
MRPMPLPVLLIILLATATAGGDAQAADASRFEPIDVFELEWASDPQISPDGGWIAYVRNFMDIQRDRRASNIWLVRFDGSEHRPLTSGSAQNTSPRWSPDGERLLYVSTHSGSTQLHVAWLDAGQEARLTQLTEPPSAVSWSPDGRQIALSMSVPYEPEPLADLPEPPEGAEWAARPRVVERVTYRADGTGFLDPSFTHKFVVPAEGGTPRQVTSGDFHHRGASSWSPDGSSLIFSANRHPDWELEPQNSEIYELVLEDGTIRALTDRFGPDHSPVVSPDGTKIAYLGFDDRYQGYQVTGLYVMDRDGSEPRLVTADLDRDVEAPRWSADGRALYFLYSDRGNTKLARTTLAGEITVLADDVGGLSLGRPYAGGAFSLSPTGRWAYTESRPSYPADVAAGGTDEASDRLTRLNQDLFG